MHKESHQYIDLLRMIRPITKWNARVSDPRIIPEVVRKAFKVAQQQKPGSTHLELPEDVMEAELEAEPQHWETARLVTTHAFAWLREQGPDEERVLNVNVPDIPADQLRGLRPAQLASFGAVQARVKEKGRNYVMLTYSGVDAVEEPGSDHDLLTRGWATATLLTAPYDEPGDTELPSFTGRGSAPVSVDIGAGTVMSSNDDKPTGEIVDDQGEAAAAR